MADTRVGIWSLLVGGAMTLAGAAAGAFINQHLATKTLTDNARVQIFVEYEQQFFYKNAELSKIRRKFYANKRLTDDEMDYYLGYFEDVGALSEKNLIDMYLVDQLLGGYVKDAYDDKDVQAYIRKSRTEDNEPDEYENFEHLALELEAKDAAERAKKKF